MRQAQSIAQISVKEVEDAMERYASMVPTDLKALDSQRYEELPSVLAERVRRSFDDENSGAWISKDELVTLMQWKLKHGTFRPRLLQLIKSNSEETVHETSRAAFRALRTDTVNNAVNDAAEPSCYRLESIKAAIEVLTKLTGVGPATASLVLSIYEPCEIPFFSDELARWSFAAPTAWDESEEKDIRPHPCWKMPLKYNIKEYMSMCEEIRVNQCMHCEEQSKELPHELRIPCQDLEKTAWVLYREDSADD